MNNPTNSPPGGSNHDGSNRADEQRHAELQDYLDGRLSSDEVRTLEATLATDGALREQLDALRRVGDLVRASMPDDASMEPPLDFAGRVRQQIDAEASRQTRRRWGRIIAYSYAAAALVVAAFSVHWMFTQSNADRPAPETAVLDPKAGALRRESAPKETATKGHSGRAQTEALGTGRNELRKTEEVRAPMPAPAADAFGPTDGIRIENKSAKDKSLDERSVVEGKPGGQARTDASGTDAPSNGVPKATPYHPGGGVQPELRDPSDSPKKKGGAPQRGGASKQDTAPTSARARAKSGARAADANAPQAYFAIRTSHPGRARGQMQQVAVLLRPTGDAIKDKRRTIQLDALLDKLSLVRADASGRAISPVTTGARAPRQNAETAKGRKNKTAPKDRAADDEIAEADRDAGNAPPKLGPVQQFDDTWDPALLQLLLDRLAARGQWSSAARSAPSAPTPAGPTPKGPTAEGPTPSKEAPGLADRPAAPPAPRPGAGSSGRIKIRVFHR